MHAEKRMEAFHEPTHPRPLPGAERAFVRVPSVPLLGGVRDGFMVPLRDRKGVEALNEPGSAAVPAASCGGVSPPSRTPGGTPGALAGEDACATSAGQFIVHARCLPASVRALRAAAFTLVELLTVIAVLAVLASLLMTAVASAKKKSRTAICMVNLHQISLALDMYLDDFGKRPPSVDDLVSGKYLPAPRSLLCPEDRTGNWGRLVQSGNLSTIIGEPVGGPPAALNEPVKYSYLLHPLSWDDMTWDRLMQAGGSAGVAACQLHGLGTQDVPDVHRFSGLLLRAQKDGAVVRRRIFWTTEALPSGIAFTTFGTPGSVPDLYPLQIYLDDPAHWFQSSP